MYFTANSGTYDPYDEPYRALCEEFSGELTEEKDEMISERLESSREIIGMREAMRTKMMLGEITGKEYSDYIDKAEAAESENIIYSRLSAQAERIKGLRWEAYDAEIIYDSGRRELLSLPTDIYFIFALIFLFGGIFACEDRCRMTDTVKTTASGLSKLSAVKFILVEVLTALLFFIFTAVDLVKILSEHPLQTPFYSALALGDANMSLMAYALLLFAAKLTGYLALSAGVWTVGRIFLKK